MVRILSGRRGGTAAPPPPPPAPDLLSTPAAPADASPNSPFELVDLPDGPFGSSSPAAAATARQPVATAMRPPPMTTAAPTAAAQQQSYKTVANGQPPSSSSAPAAASAAASSAPASSAASAAASLNAAFDNVVSGRTSVGGLSNDEVIAKLRSVMAENLQLRETLQQNNLALKQQLRVLSAWKNDVGVSKTKNEEQHRRSKQTIEELKKENKELKEKDKEKDKSKKKDKKDKCLQDDGPSSPPPVPAHAPGSFPPPSSPPSSPSSSPAMTFPATAVRDADASVRVSDAAVRDADAANTTARSADARVEELTRRLNEAEEDSDRLNDDLEQMTAQKSSLERDVAALQSDNERQRLANDAAAAEKWELGAANADLQNRLQQAMAMTYMTASAPDPSHVLQEEMRKLQMTLSDERKVTGKLSRNLELEKRKNESLEQKLKGSLRKPGGGSSGGGGGGTRELPEEMRQREDQLTQSMEKYRLQCESIATSLEECEEKLAGFAIQEDYHVSDLRGELAKLKKLLSDERKRSAGESARINDIGSIFGTVFKDYQSALETLKELHNEKKAKSQQSAVYEDIRASASSSASDGLTARLLQAEERLEAERRRGREQAEKIKQMELDVEAIPILKAQVDVYQCDFNAERAAREKIAGQKADLEEELRKSRGGGRTHHEQQQLERYQLAETAVPAAPAVRRTINDLADRAAAQQTQQQRMHRDASSAAGAEAVPKPFSRDAPTAAAAEAVPKPATARRSPQPAAAASVDRGGEFRCPKCRAGFAKLEPLEAHVNACLDKD